MRTYETQQINTSDLSEWSKLEHGGVARVGAWGCGWHAVGGCGVEVACYEACDVIDRVLRPIHEARHVPVGVLPVVVRHRLRVKDVHKLSAHQVATHALCVRAEASRIDTSLLQEWQLHRVKPPAEVDRGQH